MENRKFKHIRTGDIWELKENTGGFKTYETVNKDGVFRITPNYIEQSPDFKEVIQEYWYPKTDKNRYFGGCKMEWRVKGYHLWVEDCLVAYHNNNFYGRDAFINGTDHEIRVIPFSKENPPPKGIAFVHFCDDPNTEKMDYWEGGEIDEIEHWFQDKGGYQHSHLNFTTKNPFKND